MNALNPINFGSRTQKAIDICEDLTSLLNKEHWVINVCEDGLAIEIVSRQFLEKFPPQGWYEVMYKAKMNYLP